MMLLVVDLLFYMYTLSMLQSITAVKWFELEKVRRIIFT